MSVKRTESRSALRCSVASGPNRTLGQRTAKVDFEPIVRVRISRCMRSQRGKCCVSVEFGAAAQRENRSFTQAAAKTNGRIHTLRTLPPFANQLLAFGADLRATQTRPGLRLGAVQAEQGKMTWC
jgi:hypothetical protein